MNESTDLMELSQATYEINGEKIKLSPVIVKKYLVSGDASKVSDQEVMMFIKLCQYQKLNPFLREAYLIKFGDHPATLITGKDTFTKRAAKSKNSDGYEAGILVQNTKKEVEFRVGAFFIAGVEKLLGGWSTVYRVDKKHPVKITVGLEEYIGKKSNGEVNGQWSKKPATMIRKVALVQGLREAFPEDFEGMYSPEEMNIDDNGLDDKKIDIKAEMNKGLDETAPRKAEKIQKDNIWGIAQEKEMSLEELKKYSLDNVKAPLNNLTHDQANSLLEMLEKYVKPEPEPEPTQIDAEQLSEEDAKALDIFEQTTI